MVSKGLAGAAALACALASVGAFAPGKAFVRNPLTPASHGVQIIDRSMIESQKVRKKKFQREHKK